MRWAFIWISGAIAAYHVLATARLVRFTGYSRYQKAAQLLLIWLLPLVGALVVHFVIRSTEKRVLPADRTFTPQEEQTVGS